MSARPALDVGRAPRLPLSLEVRDLRLVDAVARRGNLTRAARELHLTESALSHQLASLERRVGTPVFARVSRRMIITPAGERLRAAARTVLGELLRAEDDLAEAHLIEPASVRIAAECCDVYRWLHPALAKLRRELPEVQLRVLAVPGRSVIARLLDGRLNVAVVTLPVAHPHVTTSLLLREELVAVVPAGHPWASRPFIEADDMRDAQIVGSASATHDGDPLMRFLRAAGARARHTLPAHLADVVVEMVMTGLGVALLDRGAVAAHVAAGRIAAVPLTSRGVHRTWSVATLGPPSRYARALVRTLAAGGPSVDAVDARARVSAVSAPPVTAVV